MSGSIKILFTVALREEALPIIDFFGLERDAESGSQPVYRNENMALIVSGLGKIKAAAATARLFSRETVARGASAINIGIAGAVHPASHPKSQIFLIHKIVDNGSAREFFPDMIIESALKETMVTTFDAPVTLESTDIPTLGLVDMEASGFFETASLFLGPHRIVCLKIVSDHLEGTGLKGSEIRSLVASHAHTIGDFTRRLIALCDSDSPPYTEAEAKWMDGVGLALRLTVSQKHMLKGWVLSHRLKTDDPLPDLKEALQFRPTTKVERNSRFEEIRKILTQ